MTLEKSASGDFKIRELERTEFAEHEQAIEDAEGVLGKYRDYLQPKKPIAAEDEEPPTP